VRGIIEGGNEAFWAERKSWYSDSIGLESISGYVKGQKGQKITKNFKKFEKNLKKYLTNGIF